MKPGFFLAGLAWLDGLRETKGIQRRAITISCQGFVYTLIFKLFSMN